MRLNLPVGSYSVQAVFHGNNQWDASKSLTQSFTITSSSQPPTQSSGVAGMEWIMILIPVIIIVGVVVAIKSRKKTPKATPQRKKTFGVKQPKKRRTAGSPVGASSSTDGPSTYGYFECPNCHEPSAPQGKLGQNPQSLAGSVGETDR